MSNIVVRRNRFGGLKVKLHGHSIDIWQMQHTWAFREGYVAPARFEYLPQTTFLNLDAVILELFPTENRRRRRFFEYGFLSGIERQTIEINLSTNPSPPLCVIRSIILANTTGFRIGPNLARYLHDVSNRMTIEEFEAIQQSHFGTIRRSIDELRAATVMIEKELVDGNSEQIALSNVQIDFDTWIDRNRLPSKPDENLATLLRRAWHKFQQTLGFGLQVSQQLFR